MAKTIPSNLLPYLFRKNVLVKTKYTFYFSTGTETYITDNDSDGLSIKRSSIKSEEGTIINELEIGLDNVDLEFRNKIMAGIFDNVFVEIYLAFFNPITGSAVEDLLVYAGYVDEPKGDEHWVTLTIRPFPLFEREFPRRIFQPSCNWTFCDNYCGLDIDDYSVNTSLTADATGVTLTCAHGEAVNYFVPGFVELTSGDYSGQMRPVYANDISTITLRIPFDNTIASGTTIKAVKLCSKTVDACQNIFDNYDNFGGFAWVPKSPII